MDHICLASYFYYDKDAVSRVILCLLLLSRINISIIFCLMHVNEWTSPCSSKGDGNQITMAFLGISISCWIWYQPQPIAKHKRERPKTEITINDALTQDINVETLKWEKPHEPTNSKQNHYIKRNIASRNILSSFRPRPINLVRVSNRLLRLISPFGGTKFSNILWLVLKEMWIGNQCSCIFSSFMWEQHN